MMDHVTKIFGECEEEVANGALWRCKTRMTDTT